MILARTVLGPLVRETAIACVRSHAVPESDTSNPQVRRQTVLDDIGKRFASIDCTPSQFLANMFSAAKELRGRGTPAVVNNTVRARTNTGTNSAQPSPLSPTGMQASTPPEVRREIPMAGNRPPAGSFMGTARGAVTAAEDAASPRSATPTAVAMATARANAASPVPAPTAVVVPVAAAPLGTSAAWRTPEVWKTTELSGSPSANSALRERVAVESLPNKGLSARDDSRRQSRVMLAKDVTAVLNDEAQREQQQQRSGSFSSTTPTPVPLSATPKLDLLGGGRRPSATTTAATAKESGKPPSPNSNNPAPATFAAASALIPPLSPPSGGQAAWTAPAGWRPAVTKTPVTKP